MAIGKWMAMLLLKKHKQHSVDDGRLAIDIRPERETKAFTVGRKNRLFAHHSDDARASCIHYSLVGTVIANGLDPQSYIAHLLNQLGKRIPTDCIDDLVPWNVKRYVNVELDRDLQFFY